MSKIPSPHFQMEIWAIAFSVSFMINFGIVYISPIYQSLNKRIWFTILFFISKRVVLCFRYWIFFAKLWLIWSQLKLSRAELPKSSPSILMENCDHTICPVLSILFYVTKSVRLGFLKIYLWARAFL